MHLLLDLDGTLTDSFPGISRCINYALTELGRKEVPEAHFRHHVGRPLATMFGVLLETNDAVLIDRAVAVYRDRFDRVGIFENSLYPGILEALDLFQRWGHSLAIVTMKPAPAARRVASHFGIEHYFTGIHGPDLLDRTCTKADLLRLALSGHDRVRVVMIGDHVDDVTAAKDNGVRALAAGWGYSGASELKAASPDYFAATVSDLVAWVQTAR
jgi:phosphoglycolate phosphatase